MEENINSTPQEDQMQNQIVEPASNKSSKSKKNYLLVIIVLILIILALSGYILLNRSSELSKSQALEDLRTTDSIPSSTASISDTQNREPQENNYPQKDWKRAMVYSAPLAANYYHISFPDTWTNEVKSIELVGAPYHASQLILRKGESSITITPYAIGEAYGTGSCLFENEQGPEHYLGYKYDSYTDILNLRSGYVWKRAYNAEANEYVICEEIRNIFYSYTHLGTIKIRASQESDLKEIDQILQNIDFKNSHIYHESDVDIDNLKHLLNTTL